MQPLLLATTASWLLAAAPLALLCAVALIGRSFGEWGGETLLAYAAVLLAFLGGAQGITMATGAFAYSVAITAVLASFLALTLGGALGLSVLAIAYGALTVLILADGAALPVPLPIFAAVCCTAVAAAYYIRS